MFFCGIAGVFISGSVREMYRARDQTSDGGGRVSADESPIFESSEDYLDTVKRESASRVDRDGRA